MVEHEEHSDLHGLYERYVLETSDYTHILHLGDHEPLLLGSPLTAQVITIYGGVQHIPCGATIVEVYAPTYWGMDIWRIAPTVVQVLLFIPFTQ
jgi:hypothetical protein